MHRSKQNINQICGFWFEASAKRVNIIETVTFNSRCETVILSSFCFLSVKKATRQRISITASLYILSALCLKLVVSLSAELLKAPRVHRGFRAPQSPLHYATIAAIVMTKKKGTEML